MWLKVTTTFEDKEYVLCNREGCDIDLVFIPLEIAYHVRDFNPVRFQMAQDLDEFIEEHYVYIDQALTKLSDPDIASYKYAIDNEKYNFI